MSPSQTESQSPFVRHQDALLYIRPNSSLTPCNAKLFILGTALAMGLISGSLAVAGYWLVLPFAGLELAALAAALWVSMERGRYQEVVRIQDSQLVVEKGKKNIQERVEFPRYQSSVQLISSTVASYPSRLIIACQGRQLEIGKCLTETERLGLSKRLKELVGASCFA